MSEKLDDMCATAAKAAWGQADEWAKMSSTERDISRQSMRAVLREHVQPMIASVFEHGGAEATSDIGPPFTGADSWPTPEEYAARIIKALTND